jgi:hypothetical protein
VKHLKRFGSGKKGSWQGLEDLEIWLFPNFGKQYGFGEPDVLLLAGKFAFWFEVEMTIDCQGALPALRRSLVQLWRFRLLQDALGRPPVVVKGGKRIVGRTLSDAREVRDAALCLRGHGVLQKALKRLRTSEGHYVLFTYHKPKGHGGHNPAYARALERERALLVDGYPDLPLLPRESSWYAYWNGDLADKFSVDRAVPLDVGKHFVRTKARFRARPSRS